MGSSNRLLVGRIVLWVFILIVAGGALWVVQSSTPEAAPAELALITADGDPYWDRLIDGANDAATKFGVTLTVHRGDGSIENQTALLNKALEDGCDALAISPVDANKQALLLRQAAATRPLVTVDSDSEHSRRLCFVGADNYAAGRRCGELVKEALPEGARVAIVMGPIIKANGERRRQGIIDELLDRSFGPGRPTEPMDEEHVGETYTVAATLTDEIDEEVARQNVIDALTADPEINCLVGIFAYSTPAAVRAVQEIGRSDEITILGFDDRPETLDAIAAGQAYAALAQDQYSYGYDAVRLLADAARGKDSLSIPLGEAIHFPPYVIRSDNVEQFRLGQRPID